MSTLLALLLIVVWLTTAVLKQDNVQQYKIIYIFEPHKCVM